MTMTMTDVPGAELAVRAQPVLPMAPDQAKQMMQAYQELTASIIGPDDLQRVDDKEFVKRSGFQKIAAAYGVSTEILRSTVETVVRDDETILVARAVARATHPSGRHAEGDGACASNEKRFRKGDQRMEHNLAATAVTRAVNRAVSNLVAFGSISAEEAEAPDTRSAGPGGTAPLPAWAAPAPDIAAVAHALTELFKAAGADNPGKAAVDVGNAVFKDCGDTVPLCVARAVEHIAAHLSWPLDATATEEPATAPDTSTTTQEEAA